MQACNKGRLNAPLYWKSRSTFHFALLQKRAILSFLLLMNVFLAVRPFFLAHFLCTWLFSASGHKYSHVFTGLASKKNQIIKSKIVEVMSNFFQNLSRCYLFSCILSSFLGLLPLYAILGQKCLSCWIFTGSFWCAALKLCDWLPAVYEQSQALHGNAQGA